MFIQNDTKIAYCRFQFDGISTNIYGRDEVGVEKLWRKVDNLVLAVLQSRKLLEYQPIMWLIQSSILLIVAFLIAEPHCEVNLIIVSVEHRIEAVRKHSILHP